MRSFILAIEKTVKHHGPFYGAIGHSLGGMALFNALNRSLVLQKLVIMGSPSTIPNVIHDFALQVRASPKVERKLIATIEKKFNLKVEDLSIVHLAQKHNPKGLILHDEQDVDVPVFNAKQTAAAWPKADLHLSNGLGHRRILMDSKTISTLYDFFKN
jgi:pimeloyl-ACP methyl ester carboxylesterase